MRIISKEKEYSVKVKDVEFETYEEAYEMKYAAEGYIEDRLKDDGAISDVLFWIGLITLFFGIGAFIFFMYYITGVF